MSSTAPQMPASLRRAPDMPASGWIGPILYLDTVQNGALALSVLMIGTQDQPPPPLEHAGKPCAFHPIANQGRWHVFKAQFTASLSGGAQYTVLGQTHQLAAAFDGDLNIAFASCNGEEHGDLERDPAERNVMWARLLADHKARPFHLLLHGGDQIYADEVTKGHGLSEDWPDTLPKDPARADLEDLRAHLRAGFFERYIAFFQTCPEMLELAATVPALSQWDDHDICDGWGSLRRSRTYSPVGQTLFAVARETALIFQHACRPDAPLPLRFHDPDGLGLGWSVDFPNLRIVAPDLRSERTRRQIMGPKGWDMMESIGHAPAVPRLLVVSSVPLLGPRLSVLETIMVVIPQMQKYEDDLRDQWQSRAHRAEWQRMLGLLRAISQEHGTDITVVSGEIHLATRATMALPSGATLHQLIASGVTHRAPPRAWARILGWLASFGESPLPEAPIKIMRLPGQARRYVAERNVLHLRQSGPNWQAQWDLEHSGKTARLDI